MCGQPAGLAQECCQKIPLNVKKNAEREGVSFEWQRQLSHLKEFKALFKTGEEVAVYSAGMVCLYVEFVLRISLLYILRYPTLCCVGMWVCVCAKGIPGSLER